MTYFLTAIVVLFVLELIYFKLADRFNIVDNPNKRSSHSEIVLRGGGIIFPVSVLLYWALSGFSHFPYFIAALVVLSAVSFADDIKPVKATHRSAIQLVCVLALLWQVNMHDSLPIWWWTLPVIILVGILNAWNFMDGINGITAGYSLLTILTLYYLNSQLQIFEANFFYWIIAGLVVFSFFNMRKRAKCFAGDIGSISMAFIILFILVKVLLKTGNPTYIMLLAVYGIDAVSTIISRWRKGENIFLPHRQHLYQYLANEKGWKHLQVTALYVFIQLVINILVIGFASLLPGYSVIVFGSLLVLLCLLYWLVKQRVKHSLAIR